MNRADDFVLRFAGGSETERYFYKIKGSLVVFSSIIRRIK